MTDHPSSYREQVVLPLESGGPPSLFDGPVVLTPYREHAQLRPAVASRVLTLERQAPQVVRRAQEVGVAIKYLGVSELFSEQLFFPGPKTDWVFGPADEHELFVVPRPQRQQLQKLVDAGVNFPTYIAHESRKERALELPHPPTAPATRLDRADAAALVGPVPAPPGAVELGERLGHTSTQILDGIRRGAPIAGKVLLGIAAAPVILVGGAIAGLASVDPIIFGAQPVFDAEPGQPALWFQLVAWEW